MKYIPLLSLLLLCTFCSENHKYSSRKIDIKGLPTNISSVATGNLMGSALDELLVSRDSTLFIYQVEKDSLVLQDSMLLSGDQMIIQTADLTGDFHQEVILLTGWRRYVDASIGIYFIRADHGKFKKEELYRSASPRPQPVSLLFADINNDGSPEIVASWFESKYFVKTVTLSLTKGTWAIDDYAVERMAMSRDIGKISGSDENLYVVGKVYGDSLGLDGYAYVGKSQEILLPAKRGVKAVKVGDGDNDGQNEIYIGDGWHFDYGKIARSRLAVIRPEGPGYKYQLIEDVKYQYDVAQIEVADITGNHKNEVITRGNRFFRIYRHEEVGWKVFTDTLIPQSQFAIGNIIGDKHPEVIFAGKEIQVWQFSQPEFTTKLGEEVKTEMQEPDSLIGKQTPELSIQAWFNGSFSGMSNNRGKVILLDFWATWCTPCIKTFPTLYEWQNKYGDQGFQILGLTRIDDRQSRNDLETFIEKEDFPYPIGLSNESHNNLAFGVGSIPHVVLIDRQGIIRHLQIGSGHETELETQIQKLLKSPEFP